MASLNDILGNDDANYQSSGTLTKLLQGGVLVEDDDEEKLSTRKKKALEIQKVKEGVKVFGAVDPSTMPQGPEGGVTGP